MKIVAVALGFVGAMLILRPESADLLHSGLALLVAFYQASIYVLTRQTSIGGRAVNNVLIQSIVGSDLVSPIAIFYLPLLSLHEGFLNFLMGALSCFNIR